MIKDLKQKISLLDEISKYCKVIKKGHFYWTLCPFHKEKTPSFSISEEKQTFHCFGCGLHGDVFSFLQNYHHLDFSQILQKLGEEHDVKIYARRNKSEVDEMFSLNEVLKNFYHSQLLNISYAQDRGLSAETCEKFALGFAPADEAVSHLLKQGFSLSTCSKMGVLTSGSCDRFRNRFIIPIFDRQNKIIGFAGRTLEEKDPKYLNSLESSIYQKSLHLFNENQIIYNKPIILVEGYLDAISLTQNLIENVVATMGTAISIEQLTTAFRFTNKIYVMFDGDEAGRKAIERNLFTFVRSLKPSREIYICNLESKDPDEAVRKDRNLILKTLEEALLLSEWIWTECKFGTAEQNSLVLEKISEICSKIEHPSVKKAYQIFFREKTRNIYSQKEVKKLSSSPEKTILNLLCTKPKLLEDVIEELMAFSFSLENYEKFRVFIVDTYTIQNNSPEEIMAQGAIKYGFANLEADQFSFLTHETALSYLRDLLQLRKRKLLLQH